MVRQGPMLSLPSLSLRDVVQSTGPGVMTFGNSPSRTPEDGCSVAQRIVLHN